MEIVIACMGHEEHANRAGRRFFCSNVKHNSRMWSMDACVPALTTESTFIWGKDLATGRINRPMLPYELLGVHGWPVLLARDHDLSNMLPSCFTFRHAFQPARALDAASITRLAGNGMYIAQVTMAITGVLLGVSTIDSADAANSSLSHPSIGNQAVNLDGCAKSATRPRPARRIRLRSTKKRPAGAAMEVRGVAMSRAQVMKRPAGKQGKAKAS